MPKKLKRITTSRTTTKLPVGLKQPILRFSPTAWAKLLFLRDYGETEVGGFGITASDHLLLVENLQLVRQQCSWAHVAFDDESVADLFDDQHDAGRQPEQFARVWIHTHPGDCPRPSMTDEQTFDRVFGCSDWAVMFILAREGECYARLRFNVGPRAEFEIPVNIDYTHSFGGSEPEDWEQEYLTNVQQEQTVRTLTPTMEPVFGSPFDEEPMGDWYESWLDYTEEEEELKGMVP